LIFFSLLLGSSLDPNHSPGFLLGSSSINANIWLLLLSILAEHHSLGHEQVLELRILILAKSLQNLDHVVSSLIGESVHSLAKHGKFVDFDQGALDHVHHDGEFKLKNSER
jgi:hypothetical protein